MVVYRCSNPDCVWNSKNMDKSIKVCPKCGGKVRKVNA